MACAEAHGPKLPTRKHCSQKLFISMRPMSSAWLHRAGVAWGLEDLRSGVASVSVCKRSAAASCREMPHDQCDLKCRQHIRCGLEMDNVQGMLC